MSKTKGVFIHPQLLSLWQNDVNAQALHSFLTKTEMLDYVTTTPKSLKKQGNKQSDATNIILISMYNEHMAADGAHQTCP